MKKIYLFTLLCAFNMISFAQVGIGTTSPNANAALHLKSSSQGMLFPRMTTAQRDAINSGTPAEGLTIFNITDDCIQTNIGTSIAPVWQCFEPTNATCVGKTISATPCAAVTGATLNDDDGVDGIEYDWTGATGNMSGGNTRALVEIGGQCWFRRNTTATPTAPIADAPNTGANQWYSNPETDNGYWGYYNTTTSDGSAGWSPTAPADDEGLLYQWSAAMNGATTERAQGVCPTDWHVPSDCEWMYLENSLGMTTAEQQDTFFRSSGSVGSKLSTLTDNGGGTNSSGFTALLAGYRSYNGRFANRGTIGHWWSSSSEAGATNNAHTRTLAINQVSVNRGSHHDRAHGYSVRCLKD
jgi:uncharacterized protein (TIGR02145 family)